MAEGDGGVYNNFKEQVLLGTFNLGNGGDTLKIFMWHTTAPDIDSHTAYSDYSANEVSDGSTNYTAGGETLASQAVSQDNANDLGKFDADDVTWSSLLLTTPVDATPDYCGIYDTTASNLMICYWELGSTATNGGNYTLQFNASGILTLT
jgi:hypothetical protein